MKNHISFALLASALVLTACPSPNPNGGGAIDVAKSTVTVDKPAAQANGNDSVTITVKLVDGSAKPVSGALVTITASGTGNVLSAPGPTGADGTAIATLKSTVAEAKDISATATVGTAEAVALTQHASVTFTGGAAAKLAFSVPPSNAQAGTAIAPAVQVKIEDANGNVVAGDSDTVSLTLKGGTVDAVLGGTVQVAAVDGIATFSDLTVDKVGQGYILSAVANGLENADSTTFDITLGAPAKLAFTMAPTSVSAGAPFVVKVAVQDAGGNPVTDATAQISLAIANGPSGASLGGTTTAIASNGTATFSNLVLTQAAKNYRLAATASGFMGATTELFAVNPGLPSQTQSSVDATPSPVVADGVAKTNVTAHVRDAYGNGLPSVTVLLSATGSANTLTPSMGVTDQSGDFTATLSSTVAETKQLSATAAGFTVTGQAVFVAGAVDMVKSTIDAAPQQLPSDGMAFTTITVTARDSLGNLAAGVPVSINVTGTGNTIVTPSGSTDSSGVFTTKLVSTQAEVKTITATLPTFSLNTNVTFVPPPPDAMQSTLVATPSSLPVGSPMGSTLVVTAKDAAGNVIPNLAVTLSASGTGNTFTPSASGTTDANGQLTVNYNSTKSGTKTITAQLGSTGTVSVSTQVNFLAGPPDPTKTTFVASPSTVPANGSTASTLTLTVLDSGGNAVANQPVTVSSNGTNNTLVPSSGNTDANGVFTSYFYSTKAQTKTVTATMNGTNFTTTVTFAPGPVSTALSTFTASPNTQTANGTSAIALSLTLKDAFSNTIANTPVTLTSTGTNNTFTPSSGNTDANGVFTSAMTSTKAEGKTVTATVGSGGTMTVNVGFTSGTPSVANSNLVASPTTATANGTSAITLTTTVRDVGNNPVAGVTVTLASTGSNNTFAPGTSGATNAAGQFVATLKSTTAEAKTVTATISAGSLPSVNVTFNSAPATPNCAALLTTQSVWGLSPCNGVALGQYTNGTLDWIGCCGSGCAASSFFCTDESTGIFFGTTDTSNAMRALVDPGNAAGSTFPTTFNSSVNNGGCCGSNAPRNICNAPYSMTPNGINPADALCKAMGFTSGTIVSEDTSSNVCPKPYSTTTNGSDWNSNWAAVGGHGKQYRCFF